MFPRVALAILALLVTAIIAIFVRAEFVAEQAHCDVRCNRGIAYPYQQLLTHMRQLAEAGRTEDLRRVIVQAQERSGEISQVCIQQKEEIYQSQVDELTR